MSKRRSQERVGYSSLARAVGTSVRGNSTTFGFSIMITVSFGMVSHSRGSPAVLDLLLFGLGAAAGIALLEGLVTKGFRATIEEASTEVRMLGTAMNLISVAIGVLAALGVAELIGGAAAWFAGSLAAALAYIGAESLELLLAEAIQRTRDVPVKESEEG